MAIETSVIKVMELADFSAFPSTERGAGKLYIDSNGFLRMGLAPDGSAWSDPENWTDGNNWTD